MASSLLVRANLSSTAHKFFMFFASPRHSPVNEAEALTPMPDPLDSRAAMTLRRDSVWFYRADDGRTRSDRLPAWRSQHHWLPSGAARERESAAGAARVAESAQ